MLRKKVITKREEQPNNPFLLSFSDLMSGLLIVFVLTLLVTMIELEQRKEELEEEKDKIKVTLAELIGSLEEIQNIQDSIASSLDGISARESSLTAMLEGIQDDLEEKGIKIEVADNGTVLRIPENSLQFNLGSFEIPERFVESSNAIGQALLHALQQNKNRDLIDTVFIEGHTDSVPNRKLMGNWGLSTYRAISLWNFWTGENGEFPELKDLKSGLSLTANKSINIAGLQAVTDVVDQAGLRPLISVSGYANTRPVSDSSLETIDSLGKARDRRIDIRFTLAPQEKDTLTTAKKQLNELQDKQSELIKRYKED